MGMKPLGKINLRAHKRETTLISLKQSIRPTSISNCTRTTFSHWLQCAHNQASCEEQKCFRNKNVLENPLYKSLLPKKEETVNENGKGKPTG